MGFVHFIILPALFFITSIFMQDWLSKNEFSEIYIIYFLGFALGLIINIFLKIITPLNYYSAYLPTVILKSIFIDGLVFFAAISTALYFINNYLIKYTLTANLSLSSIMSFSFITGFFSMINIKEALSHNSFDYIFEYFPFFSYILMIVLIIGFGYHRFNEAYDLKSKIMRAFYYGFLFILVSGLYNYLRFYNLIYQYLLMLPAALLCWYFEKLDFKYFRK